MKLFKVVVSKHSTFKPIEVEAADLEEAIEKAIFVAMHYEPDTEDWQGEELRGSGESSSLP